MAHLVTFPLNPYDVILPLQMKKRFLKPLSADKDANKVDMSLKFVLGSAGISALNAYASTEQPVQHSPLADEPLQADCKSEGSQNYVPNNIL